MGHAAGCGVTEPDATAPRVEITSRPPNDTIVRKAIPVRVTASDNDAVARVELRVNGSPHDEALAPPWDLT